MTDVAKNTIQSLVLNLGAACSTYADEHLRNLPCKRVQCDEIWSFVYAKDKNVPDAKVGQFGYGDVWTWVALDADTKLVPCWLVGTRDAGCAYAFMSDLASRLTHRVQLTTDGLKAYLSAVEDAFGADIDYAALIKLYGSPDTEGQRRYSPSRIIGAQAATITGRPNPKHISTSYIERQNLTVRMSMRRFTRLTNGFSKKLENHVAAIAIHYMHYNFCRIHQSLRVTPAQEANVTERLWSIRNLVDLLDAPEAQKLTA